MTNEPKYTERDLTLAKEMSSLTSAVHNLSNNFSTYMDAHSKEHMKIWEKSDCHERKISRNSTMINKIVGGILVISGAMSLLVYFLRG